MLAVFNRSVVRLPTAMRYEDSAPLPAFIPTYYFLEHLFLKYYPQAIIVKFEESGILAIDDCPRTRMIESQEDVFCLFTGKLENKDNILTAVKLTNSATDPHIITEIYRLSKREGDHIFSSLLSEARGSFCFILYDSTCDYVAICLEDDGTLELYWGTDFEGNVLVTNDLRLAKQGCIRSYAPFPAASLYTSSGGLIKFREPLAELEHVPWKDTNGEVRGATFRIKSDRQLPRVLINPKPNQ